MKGNSVKKKKVKTFIASKKENDRSKNMEYSSLDACVCCGRYMPEGIGMVCEDCLRKIYSEKWVDRSYVEKSGGI